MPPGNPHNPNNKPMNIKGYDVQGLILQMLKEKHQQEKIIEIK